MIAVSKTIPIKVKVTKLNKDKFTGTVIESDTIIYKIGYYGTCFDNNQFNFIEETSEIYLKDSIVESVINQFKQRSEAGIKKYNTTLDRTDLKPLEWLQHLQEELMDGILYLERFKKEYEI
jgi:hypothetical protein